MLSEQYTHARRRPALVLGTLAGGLLLGMLLAAIADRSTGTAARSATDTGVGARVRRAATETGDPRDHGVIAPARATGRPRSASGAVAGGGANGASPTRPALRAALDRGVERARALGGEAAAAVWVDGDAQPVRSGPTQVVHRLWSTSKAVVAIAALRAVADDPDPVLRSALSDAIRRSDNCAIRRVIVGLQDRISAGVSGAVAAFERVLALAGAHLAQVPQAAAAESDCVSYLESHRGGLPGSPLGVAPEFGTAEWSQNDAIAFAHALSEGLYGAPGASLLGLMELPKQPPLEEPPPPSAPPLNWGAGMIFPASWHGAWKAGWGGSQNAPPHFLTTQLVVVRLGGVPVALTAIFLPRAQPATDNPGLTQGPHALELIFQSTRAGLEAERVGGVR